MNIKRTITAVLEEFQKKNGLTVTGKPDQKTLNRLGLK
jgi:peptidoglycan hydrolase-like protein with peptidoglycan-binding domain